MIECVSVCEDDCNIVAACYDVRNMLSVHFLACLLCQ